MAFEMSLIRCDERGETEGTISLDGVRVCLRDAICLCTRVLQCLLRACASELRKKAREAVVGSVAAA